MAKIAQYHIIKQLGSGHFGTVYLGFGVTPAKGSIPSKKRIVAIKQLKEGASTRSIKQLKREFALLDQVKHRCLPNVYEFIETKNTIVMEFFHGVTLRDVLDDLQAENQHVFSEAATEIACEIADALYQVYTTPGDNGEPLKLVHRDLKPANIILTSSGEIKILDFGLARVNNTEFTAETTTHVKGTPIYMAPEQALGLGEEHRTDLYTLGLMLYELLIGKPAYRIPEKSADPIKEIFRDISTGTFDFTFPQLQSKLPILGKTLTKLLQKKAKDRHNNGQELLIELRRLLNKSQGTYISEFAQYYFSNIHQLSPPPNFEELQQKYSSEVFQRKSSPRVPSATQNKESNSNKSAEQSHSRRGNSISENSRNRNVRKVSNQRGNQDTRTKNTRPRRPVRNSTPSPLKNRSHQNSNAKSSDIISASPLQSSSSQTTLNQRDSAKQQRRYPQHKESSFVSKNKEHNMAKSKRPPRPKSNAFQSSNSVKSPDDPGMLSTVPLHDEESDDSATQFFARPAPKASTPVPPPNRQPSGNFTQSSVNQSSSFAPPPIAPPRNSMPQHNPAMNAAPARPPMGGMGAGGIGAGGIGVGGIGAGGMGGGMSSPVAVASTGHSSAEQMEGSGRTGSQRVWILLLCAFIGFVICCIIVVYVFFEQKPEEVVKAPERVEYRKSRPQYDDPYEDEEDEVVEVVEEKPKPIKRKKSAKKKPKPKVPVVGANLNVKINGAQVTQLELKCPSKRYRARVNGKMGNFTDLPNESCELFFKPTPAKFGPFTPSGTINCNITGGGAAVNCK